MRRKICGHKEKLSLSFRLPESSEGGYINIGHSEVHYSLYLIFSLYFLLNDTSDCVSLSSGNFLFKKKKDNINILKKTNIQNLVVSYFTFFFCDKQIIKLFKSKMGTMMDTVSRVPRLQLPGMVQIM